jgi:hypothetical protein
MNRATRVIVSLFSIICLLTASLVSTTLSASAAPTAGNRLTGTGSKQCAVDKGSRRGPWVCGKSKTTKIAQPNSTPTKIAQPNGTPPPDDAAYFCYRGCYNKTAAHLLEYEGSGEYGYGDTVLGYISWMWNDAISGAAYYSNPISARLSSNSEGVTLSVERLDVSSGGAGSAESGGSTYRDNYFGSVAGDTTSTWREAYTGFDNTVPWMSVLHKADWQVPGYPGHWYVAAKSIRAYLVNGDTNSAQYWYDGNNSLPDNPESAGYVG